MGRGKKPYLASASEVLAAVSPEGAVSPLTSEEASEIAAQAAYWGDRDMAFDHNHCFLCGIPLDDDNRTDEHVFPRWLQRDFDLWNEELVLLNGARIRYSSLTIPCCRDCNGYWLSQVENKVATAFRSGPGAVAQLDETLLSLWMGKIYYGIHFKEIAIPANPRLPSGPTIVDPKELERFSELHHVLQAMRQRVRFSQAPGSLFIYEAQVPSEPRHRFDYRDSRRSPFLAIRAGRVVVIAALLDWGAMKAVVTSPAMDTAQQLELHPYQFQEVTYYAAYVASKFNRHFVYLVSPEGDHDVIEPLIRLEVGDDPEAPPFDDFVSEEYAVILAESLGLEVADVYQRESGNFWSCLRRSDGSPNFISVEEKPVGMKMVPEGRRSYYESQ